MAMVEKAMVRIKLPLPPSTNMLFLNPPKPHMRRPVNPIYSRWQWEARAELLKHPRDGILGPYRLRLLLPLKMRGDIDNRIKAVSDFLVAHAITSDDRQAQSVSAERSAEAPEGWAIVEVEAA